MDIRKLSQRTWNVKTKKESVLINPSQEDLEKDKGESRIVIQSLLEVERPVKVGESQVLLMGPGEYEIGGVQILGINSSQGSTIYMIESEGVKVVWVGELKEDLNEKKLERIENTDVLMAPLKLGGNGGSKLILDWAKKLGANYLIPHGFENKEDEELKKLLDAVDMEGVAENKSLKVSKETLPEGMEVVVLI
jgi:hypothetical protein